VDDGKREDTAVTDVVHHEMIRKTANAHSANARVASGAPILEAPPFRHERQSDDRRLRGVEEPNGSREAVTCDPVGERE
jgi:hypothetical protein